MSMLTELQDLAREGLALIAKLEEDDEKADE